MILSNNDGCIIARSNEAKAVGIPFRKPFFKCRELIEKHQVFVFSSNYELYGDMSFRVMDTLSQFTPDYEIYSIDEAFLLLSGFAHKNLTEYGKEISETVKQWTGIPISIGIATTKTLAKIANHIAKRSVKLNGVYDISKFSEAEINAILKETDVGKIWGIGGRYEKFLKRNQIYTAFDLKNCRDNWIRKNLTVVGLKTVFELRGIPSIELEQITPPNKQIVSSRSFGKPVSTLQDLEEAVATYASRATVRLRKQNLLSATVTVFIATNRFKKDEPQYSNSQTFELAQPTDDTSAIIKIAHSNLRKIFKKGFNYRKAGIMLSGIQVEGETQLSLFSSEYFRSRNQKLMKKIDKINKKWGSDTIRYASTGYKKNWKMKREMKSPSYTTNWNELPVAKANSKKMNGNHNLCAEDLLK